MKKRIWLYALTGFALAVFLGGAVTAFVFAEYLLGSFALIASVISLLCLVGEIMQDRFYHQCEKLFVERRFDEEKKVLDKVRDNHILFPFVRIGFYLLAIQNAAARDDLSLAKNYIDRLRHGGDVGLKYRTSYVTVLIYLDENNLHAAREEYEDFRIHNERYALYKSQLEVLGALFTRLYSKTDKPLPEAAVNSYFPVVKRILGRHIEESAKNSKEWEE